MAKSWTHTSAFAHFGTTPRNVQWSWSARSEDGKTVVATLWQDEFTHKGRVYSWPGFDPSDKRPGIRELMENFKWAQDNCGSRFNVIVAIAKNVNGSPRSIAECFPHKMVMKLTHLNTGTGAFTAEAAP